jgi:hypothetical protein
MKPPRRFFIVGAVGLALTFCGCLGLTATTALEPTRTPTPTTTPTVSPTATATLSPTATSSQTPTSSHTPTQTDTPLLSPTRPTDTPHPTVTRTRLPAPTRTPAPIVPTNTVAPVLPTNTAPAVSDFQELVSLTSPVSAGAYATITVRTTPGASCSIVVYYKSGPSTAQGLGPKTAGGDGICSWTWKVGTRTTPGTWSIVVTTGTVTQQYPFVVQ